MKVDLTGLSFQSLDQSMGALRADLAARVIAATSDVAMIIDSKGIIRDISVSNSDMMDDGFDAFRERPWIDTVTIESRQKVSELLRDAATIPTSRWREINHTSPRGGSMPVRYIAVNADSHGNIIAVGRDLRAASALQQRLLQTQQDMERDYVRLREVESRYRLLFHTSSEAVLIVDASSRKVIEANPAAGLLVGVDYSALVGLPLSRLLHAGSQAATASMLIAANTSARTEPVVVELANGRWKCSMSVSMFRQDRQVHLLVRLTTSDATDLRAESEPKAKLLQALERLPDAFVLVDKNWLIVASNAAFVDLVQLVGKDAARGQSLSRFLGRSSVDLTVLQANLREHGWVRNFNTVLRNQFEGQEPIDVSAVAVPDQDQPCFGISIRPIGRRLGEQGRDFEHLPRSAQQLTDLIGRVPLKEIVRETTDIIERLCIEAALELTSNNRASAAEMLGLSRQSLYSKLHRHGLSSFDVEPEVIN